MAIEALPTTKRVAPIDRREFTAAAWDGNEETFQTTPVSTLTATKAPLPLIGRVAQLPWLWQAIETAGSYQCVQANENSRRR